MTPPGELLGVEEDGSPLGSVGCPIPGSHGSYEVGEPVPPSPDRLGPGFSAWLGALESQPGRAPPEPDSREAHPVSVGAQPCAQGFPVRSLRNLVLASSGAPFCGLRARPAEQEEVGASGSPAVGRQRDGSRISPPSSKPCPAGSALARRFDELPAAVQARSSLASLGPAAVTPPGAPLDVEEDGSPLESVGCPIPGSLGSYEVAEPVPPSPGHHSPGLSAWLGALESQPGRAPPEPDPREAHPVSVGAQPCAQGLAMRAFRNLVADLGFEKAAMVAFPDATGDALPLPWGFQELGRRVREVGFDGAIATELPERLRARSRSRLRQCPSEALSPQAWHGRPMTADFMSPTCWAKKYGTHVSWQETWLRRVSTSRDFWGACSLGRPRPAVGPRDGPSAPWPQPIGTWRAPHGADRVGPFAGTRIGEASNPGPRAPCGVLVYLFGILVLVSGALVFASARLLTCDLDGSSRGGRAVCPLAPCCPAPCRSVCRLRECRDWRGVEEVSPPGVQEWGPGGATTMCTTTRADRGHPLAGRRIGEASNPGLVRRAHPPPPTRRAVSPGPAATRAPTTLEAARPVCAFPSTAASSSAAASSSLGAVRRPARRAGLARRAASLGATTTPAPSTPVAARPLCGSPPTAAPSSAAASSSAAPAPAALASPEPVGVLQMLCRSRSAAQLTVEPDTPEPASEPLAGSSHRCHRRWRARGGEVCSACASVQPAHNMWGYTCTMCSSVWCSSVCQKAGFELHGCSHMQPALPRRPWHPRRAAAEPPAEEPAGVCRAELARVPLLADRPPQGRLPEGRTWPMSRPAPLSTRLSTSLVIIVSGARTSSVICSRRMLRLRRRRPRVEPRRMPTPCVRRGCCGRPRRSSCALVGRPGMTPSPRLQRRPWPRGFSAPTS